MQSTTIQLAVRGKPSAFDLSFNNEMCVVASPGCLTFFLLSGSGSPRHVIHYEQPQQIRQIRYQKLGHLAALRGGVVSLWDPSKCLRPLLGFVQSPGWITDLNWNLSNYNILATCSDSGGGISLWDVRSPSCSTMQLSAGRVTTSVDWCPSNQNLLAACSDSNCISVWDIRMTTPNTSSGPSIGVGSKNGSFSTITSASGGIISCHWTSNEKIVGGMSTSSKTCPSLVISKDDSSIEWWNISGIRTSTNSTSTTTNQLTHTQSSYSSADSTCVAVQRDVDHDGESIVLPAPHGNGIVICKFDDAVATHCNDSTVSKTKRIESMAGSLTAIDAMLNSSCSNPPGRRMDITLHGCPRRNTGRGIGTGAGVGVGLSTHPTEDADLRHTKGQATVLASCFEPILGLKWGVVGRLTPAAQAGFKLHMLTESAALHVLNVPVGTLKVYCDDDESDSYSSRVGTALPSTLDIRSSDEGKEINTNMKPKYSLKKSLCASTGHVEYQAHNIRQVAGYNSIPFLSGGLDAEVPVSVSMPPPHSTSLAGPGLGVGPVTGTATASTGYEYESDQGYVKARAKADLSAVLQWELLGLEERLQAGFLKGLSVIAIDQHARQVTLEVNQPIVSSSLPFPLLTTTSTTATTATVTATTISSSSSNVGNLREVGLGSPTQGSDRGPVHGHGVQVQVQERPVTLIISFPPRFPSQGLPSFAVKGSMTNVNASILVAELSAAMLFRDSQKPLSSSRCEPGFLLDIASLFLSRVVQMHSQRDLGGAASQGQGPGTPSACSTLFLSLSQPEGSLNNNNEKSKPLDDDTSSRRMSGPGSAAAYNLAEAAWEEESDKDSDAGAQEADVIDPLAYRIPCPRSSGASFSALGVLVCFGGASLSLSTQLHGHDGSRKKAVSLHHTSTSMPYPKTLADLMVAERMWSEQLALKAIEEAEASAFAAVTLEIITKGERGRSGRDRGVGKSKGGRRRRRTASGGSLFASGSDSGDVSDASNDSSTDSYLDISYPSDGREGVGDDFLVFEESLLTSAKHLDGVEMTPKSFVYSSSSATPAALPTLHGPVYDYGNRKASTAAKPTQPSSSSLTLPAQSNTVIDSRLSAGGASIAPTQGPRGRFSFPLDAAISSPVASITSPNQKGNSVSVSTATVSSSISGIALESFPSSFKMSRSGSDSQLPHNSNQSHMKSASSHSPPSYLGGGASLLPLSISNPLDSLEMLGASLDLHQEEMEGNGHGHGQVDGHGNGYEEDEEGDEAQEEGAERESIGMSSKPFRVKLYQAADVRAQLLAYHYTLGPLPSGNSDDASCVWIARASACRHNAAAMDTVDATLQMRYRRHAPEAHDSHTGSRATPLSVMPMPMPLSGRVGCHGTVRIVQQLWNLLASSIEVMVSTNRNYNCPSSKQDCDSNIGRDAVTSSSSQSQSGLAPVSVSGPSRVSMYDSMPLGDGSAVDWSISVLGRSMICRCVNLLQQSGDLQTLATVVCIFGGSDKLVALMAPGSNRQVIPGIVCTFSAKSIEQLLCTYAETLRRWSATLQATEVTKHMQSDSKRRLVKRGAVRNAKLSVSGTNLPLLLSLSSVKGGEVPKDELSSLEWDVSADYVTLVRLGVNCPKCGISTDIGDSSCIMSEVRVDREIEERKTEEEFKGRVKKNSAWCSSCKDYALTCSLCQMAIRGAGYFCTFCGHGGHTDHMREWFEQTVECAAGCGCRCGELAMLGHSAGITKTKYALEWEDGSDNWGGTGTGSKTHSASESLAGSTRHSLEKEAGVHERQGSGSDYFLYNSGDSSESDDQSSHSSGGGGGEGDDGFESEYTSGTASVSDDDGLQGGGRGMGSQTGAKDGFQGGHHRFREKERDSRHDGSNFKTDLKESDYSAFGQDFDN